MRIAVISDTHLYDPNDWFEAVYLEHLAPADALLHCGDMVGLNMLGYLRQHPNFLAVSGNCDAWPVAEELPPTRVVELGGVRFGMVHGWGDRTSLPERVIEAFPADTDLVLYGHLHKFGHVRSALGQSLNPGSLSLGGTASFCFIEIGPGKTLDIRRVVIEPRS